MNEARSVKYEQEIPDVLQAATAVEQTLAPQGPDRSVYHLVKLRPSHDSEKEIAALAAVVAMLNLRNRIQVSRH